MRKIKDVLRIHLLAPATSARQIAGAVGWQSGRRTAIRAGWYLRRLIERDGLTVADLGRYPGQEIIVRKADNDDGLGAFLDYPETPETERMRAEVREINATIAGADLDYQGRARVDLTACHVRRVFNNGRFDHGGRLFDGFWLNLPKAERRLLMIDCCDVVGLDYSCMGPRLAYAMVGEKAPADAYAIDGLPRRAAKDLMSAMLATSRPLRGYPGELTRESCGGLSIGDAVDAVRRAHPALESLWFTGAYFGIMFRESEILIDVLLSLARESVPALPIHDCVIVPEHAADTAECTMLETFEAHTGAETRIARES